MQTLRVTPAMVRSSWWMAGLIGVIGGMLLMLALGLGTGVTQFNRHSTQAVVVSRPDVGAPPGKDLSFPDITLGSAAQDPDAFNVEQMEDRLAARSRPIQGDPSSGFGGSGPAGSDVQAPRAYRPGP
jgi:hypothetical protein